MAQPRQYSIKWNVKKQYFIARYRNKDGDWSQKFIPREVGSESLAAEHWFIDWLNDYNKTGKTDHDVKVKPVRKTIKLLAPKWLQLRYEDPDTKPDTYKGFKLSVKNWILDNEKFKHYSIEDLDIETELNIAATRKWIRSLTSSPSSKLSHINNLSIMIADCIGEEWLDEEMTSPFDKVQIKREVKKLHKDRKRLKEIVSMPLESVVQLLTGECKKVRDYRRIKYLVALATGMRDSEIQGLMWSDLYLEAEIPHINLQRQLKHVGPGPLAQYEKLIDNKLSKDQIENYKNAVASHPKSDSFRGLPLHPLALAGLKWWKEKGWRKYVGRLPTQNDPVFARGKESLKPGESADSFCNSDSSALLKIDLKRLQLDSNKITMHSTRRTFAELLQVAGVEESLRSKLMGHAAKSTQAAHYLPQDLSLLAVATNKLPLPSYIQLERLRIVAGDVDS